MISVKKFRYMVLATSGYAVLALIINLTGPNPSKTHAENTIVGRVNVVNTTGNPVPTSAQGTTTVAGSVGITGTPNVNVTNSPAVSLKPGASIRDSDNPARQPFQADWSCTFSGSTVCSDTTSIAVPKGKELVIEFATMAASLEPGGKIKDVEIHTMQGEIVKDHFFPLNFVSDNGGVAFFAAAQLARLYADPSSTLTVTCSASAISTNGSCQGSVSGYLVDVP